MSYSLKGFYIFSTFVWTYEFLFFKNQTIQISNKQR